MDRNRKATYIITSLILILFTVLYIIVPSDNLHLYEDSIYEFNEGWTLHGVNGENIEITLPTSTDYGPDEWVTIEREISTDFPEGMTLRIRSLMQEHRVYIDDELIYEELYDFEGKLQPPKASLWLMVDLPDDIQGKVLRLESRTSVKTFAGKLNKLDYGNCDSLKFNVVMKQPFGILIAVSILVVGIIFLVAGFVIANYSDMRFYYLGLFSILISFWLISEMDLMQFLTGNRLIIGGISYIILPLIPIYFLLFLKQVVLDKYSGIIYPVTGVFFLLFLLNITLQISGWVHFLDFAIYIIVPIGLTVIMVIGMLLNETHKCNNPNAKKYLMYLSVFGLTVLLEVFAFISENFVSISGYSRVGFIIFYILLLVDSYRYINDIIVKEGETQALRKLAFKDILTGANNRAAFERAIDGFLTDKNPFRLIITDMNKLKMINDVYGHKEGDEAIKICHRVLMTSFGEYGTCYRLGGDEFACIMTDVNEDLYQERLSLLHDYLEVENTGRKYKVEVALGSDVYEFISNYSFSDFMHQVDILMYEDKRKKNK